MFEHKRWKEAWIMIALGAVAAVTLVGIENKAGASEDHENAHALREAGAVVPLVDLLRRPELQGQRVLEVELEREEGRLVYELELLGDEGRILERYYDAHSGQPLPRYGDD